MKWFVRLIILILVVGLAGPFFLKRPDGKPWMDASELAPDIQVEGAFAQFKLKAYRWFNQLRRGAGDKHAGKTKVYRWQAADGSWRFSDKPNPAGNSEAVWLDPNANLIAAPPKPKEQPKAQSNGITNGLNGVPLPMTIDPDRVDKLIKDAKAVQDLVDKRYQEIEQQTQ